MSIDTGVDTPDAGSNDFTNGDLLEIWLYARTDETGTTGSPVSIWVNNDQTAVYDSQRLTAANATVSAAATLAGSGGWGNLVAGVQSDASQFGMIKISLPNYRGTAGYKLGELVGGFADATAAVNDGFSSRMLSYRGTTAISRVAVQPSTSAKKFKVGTQLLIYKRLAS